MSDEQEVVTIHVEPTGNATSDVELVEPQQVASGVSVVIEPQHQLDTNGNGNETNSNGNSDEAIGVHHSPVNNQHSKKSETTDKQNTLDASNEVQSPTLSKALSNVAKKPAAASDGGEGSVNVEAKKAYLQYVARLRKLIPDLPQVSIRYNNLSYKVQVPVNDLSIPSMPKAFMSLLRKFTFTKPPTREVQILNSLTGRIKPGSLTLVLGPPGSGKSSYLRALAGRLPKTPEISGSVTYNGMTDHEMHKAGIYLSKIATYVNQVDAHLPLLTVRETFQFAVDSTIADIEILKDPEIIAVHKQRVELFIELLGLSECADTILGNQLLRGVSGGQKKRVTLGEMMISNARVLLLDEISTGLDSAVTFAIVEALQQWCRIMGGTVVMSLLQPTPEVFDLFDEVVLMKEGHIMYHGDTRNVASYFERQGVHNNLGQDTADFLVDFMTIPATVYKKILRRERRQKQSQVKMIEEAKEGENPDDTTTTRMVSNDAGLEERLRQNRQNQQDLAQISPMAQKGNVPITTETLYQAFTNSPEFARLKEEASELTPTNKKASSTTTDGSKNTWFSSDYAKAQYGRKYIHSWWGHTK